MIARYKLICSLFISIILSSKLFSSLSLIINYSKNKKSISFPFKTFLDICTFILQLRISGRNNCFTIYLILGMTEPRKYLGYLISLLASLISFLPAAIYSYLYSQFFTKHTYRLIGERNKHYHIASILDIGTATGEPLKTIVHLFSRARVLAIDYNRHYIPACRQLFQKDENVEVKHMDFYDLERKEPESLFDIIIFGSSFMILPDQTKALQIAQRKLTRNGRIYFLLTLYEEKTWWNRLMEHVKPILKYFLTIDFGRVTYRQDFEEFLMGHELRTTCSERLYGNFFLKVSKFYMYEVAKA